MDIVGWFIGEDAKTALQFVIANWMWIAGGSVAAFFFGTAIIRLLTETAIGRSLLFGFVGVFAAVIGALKIWGMLFPGNSCPPPPPTAPRGKKPATGAIPVDPKKPSPNLFGNLFRKK